MSSLEEKAQIKAAAALVLADTMGKLGSRTPSSGSVVNWHSMRRRGS